MASSGMTAQTPAWRDSAKRAAVRSGSLAGAAILLAVSLVIGFALASYHGSDPALNTAAAGPTENLLGAPGAWIADLLLTLFGPPAALFLPLFLLLGLRLWRGAPAGRWKRSLVAVSGGIVLIGTALALLRDGAVGSLPAGWGGAFGLGVAGLIKLALSPITVGAWATGASIAAMALVGTVGLALWIWGLGLDAAERSWLVRRDRQQDAPGPIIRAASPSAAPRAPRPVAVAPESPPPVISTPTPRAGPRPPQRDRQAKLDLRDTYVLPPLDLLQPPPPPSGKAIDRAGLERNARLLESVLDDFHVKGRIVEIRPGPVVTMYELEPATGIKASRVIQLADDIARNMSAQSARVATIPGRTVIGIELPNAHRESVVLSELVGSQGYEDQVAQLPIILGKNI
ncbi:MAG: cell division protein FtsK, partial [Sphingomonas bacterium]|nr:cell division protein FtsK [Sphingomonas bacterium]